MSVWRVIKNTFSKYNNIIVLNYSQYVGIKIQYNYIIELKKLEYCIG